MKILIISSAALPVPPPDYAGLEALMGWLMMEFAKAGHDITLVTTKGSSLEGNHPIMRDKEQIATLRVIGTVEPNWYGEGEQAHYLAYRNILEKEFSSGEDNIVLDSTWLCYSYLSKQAFPNMNLLHIHHGMLGFKTPPPIMFPRFIGLSNGHAHYMSSNLNIPVRVFHNGIPLIQFPDGYEPEKNRGDYLLSLNRITDEKGIMDSIDIAIATNTKIKIVGDDTHVVSQEFVNQVIERCRHSNGLAQYYGLVDNGTKNQLLLNCKALISCPKNTWIEAFGLMCVEGLNYYKPFLGLTGTLFKHGYNDIIQNGVNGFLTQTPEELKQCVEKLDDINPNNCRQTVEQNFTKEIMSARYLSVFEKILQGDRTTFW